MELQGLRADPWQEDALRQLVTLDHNVLMCCCRQSGKTQTVALAAYLEAATLGGFCLVLSRSDDQAMEVMERAVEYHRLLMLQRDTRQTAHDLRLANGGRVLARPCNEDTIRSKSRVTLLIIDEAAKVPDLFYGAVTPMLNVAKGRMVLLSTPFGKRGFFHKEWEGKGRGGWKRHRYTWRDCPRITQKQVDDDRDSHGNSWVEQEYECAFQAAECATFDTDLLRSMYTNDPSIEVME